jgi:Predicted DNA modification methylase
MQTSLFGAPPATNGFRDSSFAKNKNLPLHRWVPWVAGFSANFVEDAINHYLPQKHSEAWVLDPFAGVGTTLAEAYVGGLNVVGFEINPYAALATKIKLHAMKIPVRDLNRQIAAFEQFMEKSESRSLKREPHTQAPTGFSGRTQLFSPKVERKVLYALDFINLIEAGIIRDIFRLGLGSVMVSFSNYSYEPSLTRRAAVAKPNIEDANVGLSVSAKLHLMLEDIGWVQGHMKAAGYRPKAKVFSKTIFSALECLEQRNFVDLLVTSPPYLNNYHYPRNTRPQLHWLGFTSGTGYNGARENESFGKFWQTVRDSQPIPLAFDMPELSEIIGAIRCRNTEKGQYGGPGWANYVATYFNDSHRFCQLLCQLLKPKAVSIIVLGNSIIQGVEVKTDHFFGKIGELAGLKFEDNHLLRNKRTGSSIIQSSVRVEEAQAKTVLYESGVVLRKAS